MHLPLICKTLRKIFREETMAFQTVGESRKKNRRTKNLDVLVHKTTHGPKEDDNELQTKSFSASAGNNRRHRHRNSHYTDIDPTHLYKHKHTKHHTHAIREESVSDNVQTEGELHQKISKKQLQQDNDRLRKENELLLERCADTEATLNKKIERLKEKLTNVQSINNDVVQENNAIRMQYNELAINVEEYKNSVENRICPVCEELKAALEKNNLDYNLLKNSNKELNEDVNMLKNVVYRLNVQLGRYQEKLYEHNIKFSNSNLTISTIKNATSSENVLETGEINSNHPNLSVENHGNHMHTPISWGKVNNHTLGPLLDAYQEMITEKELLIQNYELEMSNFTKKTKEILKENEELHEKLTEDDKCSAKLIVQLEHTKSELKTHKDQNDLLIKKCAIKQDKLEEVLKFYEQKVESMSRDYRVLHEEYHKGKANVAILTEKNKSLAAQQDEIKNDRQKLIPLHVHNASVEECRKLYEELKIHYESEKNKLKESSQSLSEQISDLALQIKTLNFDKENLQANIKSLESKLKKSEGKYVELQHTCSEVQMSRMACRKQLHKAMTFAKELVTEQEGLLKQLNERQWENKKVKQLGSNLVSRMDTLKSQLKTVQKDAFEGLSNVEQTLQEKESLILTMKQQHEDEIKKLKDIIKKRSEQTNVLVKDSSIPVPYYLLYKDKHG